MNLDYCNKWFLVDTESEWGKRSPATGRMTEFGVVHYTTGLTFHGKDDSKDTMVSFSNWLADKSSNAARCLFISDNPAWDYQWINYNFDRYGLPNPFGHSGRRIGDFYAGLTGKWTNSHEWKNYWVTPHDHNPVNDSLGNWEALKRIFELHGVVK